MFVTGECDRSSSDRAALARGRDELLGEAIFLELRELVHLLNQLFERSDDAITRLRRFTSHAGHELRTPLARIRGEAELALEHRDPGELTAALESTLEEVAAVRRILDALLELARSDSGDALPKEEIDLATTLGDLVEYGQILASERGIQIETEIQPEIVVVGNRELLQRAIWNVMENAIKFSPSGTQIRLRSRVIDGEIEVEILDQGPGVPASEEASIFEPFFRSTRNSRAVPGEGLGLPLARSIARRFGGELDLVPEVTSGAAFRFRFPATS